jgi:hypothetical protein
MSLLVLPNWSGEDLHNSTVNKFEGLATSIEGGHPLLLVHIKACNNYQNSPKNSDKRKLTACVNEYFRDQDKDDNDKQEARASIQIGYRAVLDSKSSDETLVSNSLFSIFLLIFFATFNLSTLT